MGFTTATGARLAGGHDPFAGEQQPQYIHSFRGRLHLSSTFRNLTLYNLYGQTVLTVSNPSETISVSDFASGLYVALIETGEGFVQRKILVE